MTAEAAEIAFVRVLGPIRAVTTTGHSVDLASASQRRLVAVLAAEAPRSVRAERGDCRGEHACNAGIRAKTGIGYWLRSAAATLSFTFRKLSGVTEMESMPTATRNRLKSGSSLGR
jgi:hypothetical protein